MAQAHRNHRQWDRSRGDTIVEVIITITVISVVLVGSFITVNRSTAAIRDSEEHSEALTLLQGQVEAVRGLGSSATSPVYTNQFFCVNSSGTVVPFTGVTTLPSLNSDLAANFSEYPATCKNVSSLYNMLVNYNSGIFTFFARWNRLGGGGDEVSLVYKMSPGL